jgi:hypothetical protein
MGVRRLKLELFLPAEVNYLLPLTLEQLKGTRIKIKDKGHL